MGQDTTKEVTKLRLVHKLDVYEHVVPLSATLKDVKNVASRHIGASSDSIRVLLRGRPLENDSATVESLGAKEGTVFKLMFTLKPQATENIPSVACTPSVALAPPPQASISKDPIVAINFATKDLQELEQAVWLFKFGLQDQTSDGIR